MYGLLTWLEFWIPFYSLFHRTLTLMVLTRVTRSHMRRDNEIVRKFGLDAP